MTKQIETHQELYEAHVSAELALISEYSTSIVKDVDTVRAWAAWYAEINKLVPVGPNGVME